MTLFTNTPQITGSEAEELFSAGISLLSCKQGFQAVVQQSAMLLHGKVA